MMRNERRRQLALLIKTLERIQQMLWTARLRAELVKNDAVTVAIENLIIRVEEVLRGIWEVAERESEDND